MSQFRTAPHNSVDYTIFSKLGRREIIEPDGWESDFMEIKRSTKNGNGGVVNKISTNLEFVGNGAEALTEIKDNLGSEAEAILGKTSMHPTKMKRVESYNAFLDVSKYKFKDGKVKVPAQESGLLAKINTYKSEKVELERLTALDGTPLQPLKLHRVHTEGKKIFKDTLLDIEEGDEITDGFRMDFSNGNYRTGSVPIPITVRHISDEHISAPFKNHFSSTPDEGEVGSIFYADNDRDKILNLDIKVKSKITKKLFHDINNGFLQIVLAKFKNGEDYDFSNRKVLYNVPIDALDGHQIDFTHPLKNYELKKGESLSLQWFGGGEFGGLLQNGQFNVDFEETIASVRVTEDSWFPESYNKILLPYEAFERVLQINTGRTDSNLFRSECFGRKDLGYKEDGEFAYLGVSTGFGARMFEDKNITLSWNDLIQSYFATRCLAYGMEKHGDIETIIVEPLKFRFQTGKVFDLPFQAQKIERKIANEFQYSSVDVGYEKGGVDYEYLFGLDEPNGKQNLTTPFKRNERKYNLLSKFNADMTGYEIARRKPKKHFPNEDTKQDNINFLMDCKLVDGIIVQKKWQDLFIKEPVGIYSPETATNLGLTPKQNLKYHGWFLNGGLFRYKDQNLVYGSAEGNTSLVTQSEGEIEIFENGNVPISMLEAPKFKTEWITFQHQIDFELNELINGYTEENGRLIPNIWFEWRFLNDKGQYEKCRIFDVKPKGEGKFKVLKV